MAKLPLSTLQLRAHTQYCIVPHAEHVGACKKYFTEQCTFKTFLQVHMCNGKSVPNKPFIKIVHQWCHVKAQHIKQC